MIVLSQDLANGAVIFVRLLQTETMEQPLSVAYRAEYDSEDGNGSYRFLLTRMKPNQR
jgi:hypothetical protein